MTLLPIVLRELSVAARRRSTYTARVGAAMIAILATIWLLITEASQISLAEQGKLLFRILSTIAFVYCLLAGVRITADCLSAERREGTLGLLFLTDLKGYDIILGKLVSSSLNAFYGLLATLPILALLLILGGLTLMEMTRVGLVLASALFFSLAAGVFVSTVSSDERKAMFTTFGLILTVTVGPYALANYYALYDQSNSAQLERQFLYPSPIYAFMLTSPAAPRNLLRGDFYNSLLITQWLSWSLLALSSVLLPRFCQVRPRGARRMRWAERWQQWSYGNAVERKAFRTRLLDRNPFFWLAGRDRLKSAYVWFFLGMLAVIWLWAHGKYRDVMLDWTTSVWFLFFVHAFLKVWFAAEICSRFIEDRNCGAMETLLTSPLTVSEISRGQQLALKRQFGRPVLVLLVADLFFLWAGSRAFNYNMPQETLALLFLAGMVMFVLDLATLRWVAMWVGLNSNSSSRAVLGAIGRVLVLPWGIYSLSYLAITFWQRFMGQKSWSDPDAWSVCICFWFSIGALNDALFAIWARRHFLNQFRTVPTQRFDVRSSLRKLAIGRLLSARLRSAQDIRAAQGLAAGFARKYWWVLTMLLCTFVGACVIWIYRASMRSQIKVRLAAMQQAGFPITLADLNRWHPFVPAEQNFAEAVKAACFQLTSPQQIIRRLTPAITDVRSLQGPLSDEMKDAMAKLVQRNSSNLELLQQAVRLDKCRLPVDWERPEAPLGLGAGQFWQAAELSQLLRCQMWLASEAGDTVGALEAFRTTVRLARFFENEPVLFAQRVRIACLRNGLTGLERVLSQHQISEDQLSMISDALQQCESAGSLHRALAGERFLMIHLFQMPERFLRVGIPALTQNKSEAFFFSLIHHVRTALGLWDRDFLSYLQRSDRYARASQLAFPAALRQIQEINQQSFAGRKFAPLDPSTRMLNSIEWVFLQEAELAARLRAAQACVAIERFRWRHRDESPQALSELAPVFIERVPADPFDGKPLRFVRLDPGYRVFSLGAKSRDWTNVPRRPSLQESQNPGFTVER